MSGYIGSSWEINLGNDDMYAEETEYIPFHHLARSSKKKKYTADCTQHIQLIYIIATIVWIIIVFALGLYDVDIWGLLILTIPIVVFFINFNNTCYVTEEIEEQMLKGNVLSFIFLITVILINWSKIKDKSQYFKILLLAILFIALSLVDIWSPPERYALTLHIRTIFNTLALILLVYVVYIYFYDIVCGQNSECHQDNYKPKPSNRAQDDLSE